MSTKDNTQHQRFERAPIYVQVEYELTNGSSGPNRVRRSLAHVGSSGLFINTEESIKAGTRLVVRFELPRPDKYRIIATARVAYAKKDTGLGVEFLALDDEDREAIIEHIASLRRPARRRSRRKVAA